MKKKSGRQRRLFTRCQLTDNALVLPEWLHGVRQRWNFLGQLLTFVPSQSNPFVQVVSSAGTHVDLRQRLAS
jgi:hypothetical protein